MASSSKSRLYSIVGLLLVSFLSAASAETKLSKALTAYELLQGFNFPIGILPQGVQSYVLRKDSSFEVYLSGDCDFQVTGGYMLRYKKKISGTVSAGSLSNLNGVSVKVLFLYIGINQVVRDGDELRFYVGPLSASFPVSNFNECPQCRCGFDCATAVVADA